VILRLDPATARARLERAVSGTPALADDDLTILEGIARAAEPDADNDLPGWDLDLAAAQGWQWRAGRLADQRKVGAEGATAENQQRYEHAMEMARHYASAGYSVSQSKFRRTDVIR
jgi:hypothetical protein